MGEKDHLTYAAVITIARPDGGQAKFELLLTPPDLIESMDGEYKPLYLCTLEDLQHYADKLEQELWEAHWRRNLTEMANSKETEVEMVIRKVQEGAGSQPRKKTDLLRYGVLLRQEAESVEVSEPAVKKAADTEPVETIEPEESAEEEISAAAPAVAEDATAEISVEKESEPSQVVKEKESVPESETMKVAPPEELRIAGRRRPIGHPTKTACDILINESAFRDMQRHALTSLNREVAGMMIGPRPEQKEDGRWIVHVSDAIIAKHTEMRGASVTYTPESWRYIHDVLAEKYPNEGAVIVGWYHTHPGFGIFLSGMDLFIHQNFFVQPWHIALVLDPVAHSSGFFTWDRDHTAVQKYDFPWPEWAPHSW